MKEAGDDLQGRLRTLLQELEQELQRANSRRSNEISSGASKSEQDNRKLSGTEQKHREISWKQN
jgi:hypothetical protein